MDTAKVFWSGRSQAVRLPRKFRMQSKEVRIRRQGNAVVLEPIPQDWSWLDEIVGRLDKDFLKAVREPQQDQHRPALDRLFR